LQQETVNAPVVAEQTPSVAALVDETYDWGPELDVDIAVTEVAALDVEPPDPFLHKSPHELAGTAFSIKPDALEDPAWDAKADLSRSAPELDMAANVAQPRYVQTAPPVAKAQEAAPISFMRPARPVRPRNGFFFAAWWFAATVLVCALAFQMLRHERDALSAHVPQSRPVLDALCELTGCTVGSVRRIESLVIDSSSFVKVQAGVYRLNFTVKNNSVTAIALPSIELTLTDLQDQPVVRRVLSAAEAGAKQAELAAGSEWSASVPLALKTAAGTEKITGYRMLVFYP